MARRGGRGASNASGRGASRASGREAAASPTHSQQHSTVPPPIQMVEAAQFDQLAQQVRTLAEAVQNLQGVMSRAPQRAQEPLLPECSPVLLNPRSFLSHGEERRREEDSRARSILPGPSHRSCAGYERRARARSQTPQSSRNPRSSRSPSRCSLSPTHRSRSLDRRVDDLHRQLQVLKGHSKDPFADLEISSQPALASRILRTPNPPGFKMPAI